MLSYVPPTQKREVAMHAPLRARDLVGERGGGGRRRIGVGHFEHRGDAAQHRRARAGLEILLVSQAGLAEMNLGVDDAGQDVQAAAIDPLARARRRDAPISAILPSKTPMSRFATPS